MCIYSIHRQNVNDTITKGSNYWVCLLPKFHTFYVPLQYTSSTDSRGQRSKTRKTKLFFKRSLKIPKNDRNMINNTSNHAFMKRWLKNKHKISNKYVTSNDYQTTFQVLSISRCWIKSKYYAEKSEYLATSKIFSYFSYQWRSQVLYKLHRWNTSTMPCATKFDITYVRC